MRRSALPMFSPALRLSGCVTVHSFYWVLEIKLTVLVLEWQALCQLSCPLSPLPGIFYAQEEVTVVGMTQTTESLH